MGAEAECLVEHGSRASHGKALLETRELRFRGDFRLVIPFTEIKSLTVSDGVLKVRAGSERSLWHLGPQAAKWADRIRNPKSVIDKLGVKSGHKVTIINIADETFMSQLRSRTNDVGRGRARTGCDVIFFGADSARELERLGKLKRYIKPDGRSGSSDPGARRAPGRTMFFERPRSTASWTSRWLRSPRATRR
jgi:hypothetical protein